MVHRYIATGLGLLIIGIVVFAWRLRHRLQQSPWLANITLGVVILQGMFGKWTVTLLLKPAIVTPLIGVCNVFAAFLVVDANPVRQLRAWIRADQCQRRRNQPQTRRRPSLGLRWFARAGLLLVGMQIALGGHGR
jgi:cytochrome c oxidase assembly protein subunit 15